MALIYKDSLLVGTATMLLGYLRTLDLKKIFIFLEILDLVGRWRALEDDGGGPSAALGLVDDPVPWQPMMRRPHPIAG